MIREKLIRNTDHHSKQWVHYNWEENKKQSVLWVARKHAYAWRSAFNSCLIQSSFKHHLFITKCSHFCFSNNACLLSGKNGIFILTWEVNALHTYTYLSLYNLLSKATLGKHQLISKTDCTKQRMFLQISDLPIQITFQWASKHFKTVQSQARSTH